MLDLIVVAALFALIGVLFSLPAAFPFVQRRLVTQRRATLIIVGLMPFIVTFMGWTRVAAGIVYQIASVGECDNSNPCGLTLPPEKVTAGTREIWLHLMTPPPFRPACYNADTEICDNMSQLPVEDAFSWGRYVTYILLPLVSAITSMWLVSRPLNVRKKENSARV